MGSAAQNIADLQASKKALFEEVTKIVTDITGVQLEKRESMVESRVLRRIHELGLKDEKQYLDYIRANKKTEEQVLVSLLTTHHTRFFREFFHFEFLEQNLPEAVERARASGRKVIRIWSAASSYGQEAYSIAMFLDEHLKRIAPDFSYEIFGSDVDAEAVAVARNGVYKWEEVKEIPAMYLGSHWVRGTAEIKDFVKAKESIKKHCKFDVVNLMKFGPELGTQRFDYIFCRNVFIYFTEGQIKDITTGLMKFLNPGGLLFIGMSESLNGLNLPVSYIGPSIYGLAGAPAPAAAPKPAVAPVAPAAKAPAAPAAAPRPAAPVFQMPKILRVLCVDDSGTVLTLLKKLLTAENGFEVVGTAVNGREAMEKMKSLQVDVMTLDIHMPEMTGVEYLEKNFKAGHPPVVMVSSVSREDSSLGLRSLALGASDFVEKPSLQNIAERGDEIRTKLRCAYRTAKQKMPTVAELGKAFERKVVVKDPDKKVRIVVMGISERPKLTEILRDLKKSGGAQPPTAIVFEGGDAMLEGLADQVKKDAWGKVTPVREAVPALHVGEVYVMDLMKSWTALFKAAQTKKASILVLGEPSVKGAGMVIQWVGAQVLIEDIPAESSKSISTLRSKASDAFPVTSFVYVSDDYFSK